MPSQPTVIDAHGRHAQAVLFSADGRTLASAGQDARVRLWSVPDFQPAGVFEGHENSVNSLSLSADERLLATGSSDTTVRIWSYPDGQCLRAFPGQLSAVFAPAGDRLATISVKGQVVVWSATSGAQLIAIPPIDKRTMAVAFSPDGSQLLIGGMGAIHRVAIAGGARDGELRGHTSVITCLRLSPDGRWLASTAADGTLRLWSTKDWREAVTVPLGGSGMLQIAFAPKSDVVAVASDHVIQSFAVKDGKLVDRIDVPLKGVYGVAISTDGKLLASAAADGRVRVWHR